MPRQTTPNIGLIKSSPSDPAFWSGLAEHSGPIGDANLDTIDAAFGALGSSGSSGYLKAAVTLTPDQIVTMDNTPQNAVTIIPAPGPGFALVVWQCWASLQFNTTAYQAKPAVANLSLYLLNGGVFIGNEFVVLQAPQIVATTGQLSAAQPDFGVADVSQLDNASVVIAMDSAKKYSSGDSNIVVSVAYEVVAVS
jgi:hypothetical protein